MIHALVGFVLNLTFTASLVRRVNCGCAAVVGSLIALNAIRIVRISILGFVRFRLGVKRLNHRILRILAVEIVVQALGRHMTITDTWTLRARSFKPAYTCRPYLKDYTAQANLNSQPSTRNLSP